MNELWSELNTWAYGIAAAIVAGAVGLIRRLATNEKQILLLKQEIAMREGYRVERDNRLDKHITDMRADIKLLTMRKE